MSCTSPRATRRRIATLGLDHAEASAVADAFDRILASHEPFPGVVMDRHWNLVRANNGAQQLFGQLIDLAALEPPVNILQLVFGPLRPHIENWNELAPTLVARARREAVGAVPDPELSALLDHLTASLPAAPRPNLGHGPVIDVAFRIGGTVHRYFSTVTTLGTATDVSLQETRIELFHPHD